MTRRQVLLPVSILTAGVLGAAVIFLTRPRVETQAVTRPGPAVRVVRVEPTEVQLLVGTHGTVLPRTESEVIAEVAGTVEWVSPSLVSGGFFEEGEPLLRVDPRDYDLAVERAAAMLERTRSERVLANKELERAKGLARREAASRARLDVVTSGARVAQAVLQEAEAALERAELDRARTEIVAPYAGRVREAFVDLGEFVGRGARIARIYAVDLAEVRLPVADAELGFLDLPLLYRGEIPGGEGPVVRLRARFAGEEHEWQGRVVRTEGEIDPRTRVVHVVAQVEDPYGRRDGSGRPPLAVGLFVEAEIEGKRVGDVFVLPRSAMRDPEHVLVVDEENRLRVRRVDVLRADRQEVVIRSGIEKGERVCVSPLEIAVEGMTVRVVSEGDGAEGTKS